MRAHLEHPTSDPISHFTILFTQIDNLSITKNNLTPSAYSLSETANNLIATNSFAKLIHYEKRLLSGPKYFCPHFFIGPSLTWHFQTTVFFINPVMGPTYFLGGTTDEIFLTTPQSFRLGLFLCPSRTLGAWGCLCVFFLGPWPSDNKNCLG